MQRHFRKTVSFPLILSILAAVALTGCGSSQSDSSASLYKVAAVDPGNSTSVARDVSETGRVVGTDGSGAFVWDGSTLLPLGDGDARAVNRSGEVVGMQDSVAYRWTWEGEALPLAYGSAHGINDAGWVVGEAATVDGALHGFLWDGIDLLDLGTLGGNWSVAYDLTDDGGAVAGWSEAADGTPRATLWRDGMPVDLGGAPDQTSMAYAVNEDEVAVGYAGSPGGPDHAFRFRDGTPPTDLGSLGGYSVAYDLNGEGHAVGESQTPDGSIRAVLWTPEGIIDLNDRIDPATGWVLVRALGINDRGQIVGQGIFDGRRQAFLLNPAP